MPVRFRPYIGGCMLSVFVVFALLAIVILAPLVQYLDILGGTLINVLVAVVFAAGVLWFGIRQGLRYLRGPYFVINPTSVTVHTPRGFTVFTEEFQLREGDTLTVTLSGGLEIVNVNGARRTLPVKKPMAHPEDWQAVVSRIPGAQ